VNGTLTVEQNRSWKIAEEVLLLFADAMTEWLDANILILTIMPLGSADGEIMMQS
jgi:hypothetical protein